MNNSTHFFQQSVLETKKGNTAKRSNCDSDCCCIFLQINRDVTPTLHVEPASIPHHRLRNILKLLKRKQIMMLIRELLDDVILLATTLPL